MHRAHRAIVLVQGTYYLVTGIWPLIHYRSFEAATGKKREPWLVRTVGALVGVIGATLLGAFAARRDSLAELRLLAAGSAAALFSIDVVYRVRGRLPWPYLVDAALEVLLIAGYAVAALGRRGGREPATPRGVAQS